MDPAENLVRHALTVRPSDIPAAAIQRAKLAILDTISVAIGGAAMPVVERVRGLAAAWGGRAESQIIGHAERTPAPIAALVNGTMARALDFDDTMDVCRNGGHVSAYVVPAALAVAERTPWLSGADLVAAVAIASDVYCRLQRSLLAVAVDTGRDNQIAVFGPTAAAIRLLGCSVEEGLNAFGIAYAQAAGEFQMYEEHADTVPLQQGLRARAGVESALFAKAGLSGPHDVFLGRYGFYRAFEPEHDLGILLDGLGQKFLNVETSAKLFPCCRVAHTAIAATLALRRAHKFGADDVESLRIGTNRLSKAFIATPEDIKWHPKTRREAMFSMPFTTAAGVTCGTVELQDFLPDRLCDPRVQRVLSRTRVEVDPAIERDAPTQSNAPAAVTVKLRDGRTLTERVDAPPGHPDNPITFEDLDAKLAQCAAYAGGAFGAADQHRLSRLIRHLEEAPDLSELFRALVPTQAAPRAAAI